MSHSAKSAMTSDGVDKFMTKTNQQHILDEFKNETHQGITNKVAHDGENLMNFHTD